MAQGRSRPYEGQMLRLDGSAVTVEARFSRIDWHDSPALLVAVRDTTERRRIELSLKESELRYRRLYDSTIVAVVSGEGRRITRANNLFLELVGWTREEFDRAGMTWSDLRPPDATLLGGMYLEGMASGNSEKPVETVFLKKNGRRVPVLLALVPVTQDPFTWIALMLDLTEIQQSRDLLSRAKKEAEEAVGELARSNRDLEQFASVSSHDLKEPLRMVTAFLSLLNERLTGCLDPQSEEYIKIAMMSATRMQELIDDLLVYSCVAREAASSIVSAADAARLAIQNLETGIREADATVRVKALPAVKANAAELTQVFQNLISNAIKFRGSMNPEVEVGAVRDDGLWRFSVKDNGIGIDPVYQDRLFKIFNRLHTTDDYPGTGIGLAVCKKIVDRQGGRIWVESEPGRGSTFNFTLPAVLETE
jgi:PAS domain S-box-containing protein